MTKTALMLATLLTVTMPLAAADLQGAWKHLKDDGTIGVWIVADQQFAIAWYRADPATFVATEGGSWSENDGAVQLEYEVDTANPERVGTSRTIAATIAGDSMTADAMKWTRLDDGAPGALAGAWLITGRQREGSLQSMRPGARRTMKILSGTRFQWAVGRGQAFKVHSDLAGNCPSSGAMAERLNGDKKD